MEAKYRAVQFSDLVNIADRKEGTNSFGLYSVTFINLQLSHGAQIKKTLLSKLITQLYSLFFHFSLDYFA